LEVLRIATRASMLARAQARIVADAIRSCRPGVRIELVPIVTRGDRLRGPLAGVGGKGLFTAELESALCEGRVDLAVHSAKDLPVEMGDSYVIVAVPVREDPRDAIVSRWGGLELLPHGATVGTSSLRRAAQLRSVRPDLKVEAIRGNVETRVEKVLGRSVSRMDAVVLAMAGLKRSGLAGRHGSHIEAFPVDYFIPAAGQGALALQCLRTNERALDCAASIDDVDAHQAFSAERFVVQGLAASCRSCLAVHVTRERSETGKNRWRALAMAAGSDGRGMLRFDLHAETADEVARELLEEMQREKVGDLIRH